MSHLTCISQGSVEKYSPAEYSWALSLTGQSKVGFLTAGFSTFHVHRDPVGCPGVTACPTFLGHEALFPHAKSLFSRHPTVPCSLWTDVTWRRSHQTSGSFSWALGVTLGRIRTHEVRRTRDELGGEFLVSVGFFAGNILELGD